MRKIAFLTLGDISKLPTMKRALGMANPMHELGWEVSIIAMDCLENRKRIAMECNSQIQTYYFDETAATQESKIKTSIVNRIKPDFVYVCSFGFRNRIIKSLLNYKPALLVEHSELLSSIESLGKARRLVHYYFELKSVFYSNGLICASKYLYNYYKKMAGFFNKVKYPILYSPYAFNDKVILAPTKLASALKEKYKDKTILIYMGGMTRNYGLFTMINAIQMLSQKSKQVKLLLMGDGVHLAEAKEFVIANKLSDNVEFLGYVPEDEISSYFEIADMLISPLNNTIQDKARCPSKIYIYLPFNKPVLTCKVGEAEEIFKEDGYYFDNSRPESLSALIENIMDKVNIQKGRIDVFQHTWTKRAEELDNWLKVNFSNADKV